MDNPAPIRLADYQPPAFLVDKVSLTFRLAPNTTRVLSRIAFRRNPDGPGGPLKLDGDKLTLISAQIDGTPITPTLTGTGLEIDAPDAFTWEAEVEIDPEANTTLNGLYMSNGMYCTQCEAEGFRRITYYPDRPDVMAPFEVRIESDLPVLLSNGEEIERGDGFALWHDPWPKPAYLFALVAGELVARSDRFRTMEGRDVALNIWVRPGDEDRCDYAMDALKRSMLWDEEVYGRAYDLDVFNIVAVDDFNMGAMENKGLNIFNSRLVLASPETATDADYQRIESVIAHEYFHNWTGNRITCRDWFQLCLKEGLTVYRDQQFSGDARSHAVQRIEDVQMLRARQFPEDAGPLAHPVRPESYVEINNFYTATVYEKGAELIGMLRVLIGDAAWQQGCKLYFERHDGQACTIEDWLKVFEDASGRALSHFARWYHQAGTPRLSVSSRHEAGELILTLAQETRPTPGQPEKSPLHMPIRIGAIAPDGQEVVADTVLELTEAKQEFRLPCQTPEAVPSVLRGFSAPVILDQPLSTADKALLLAHDTDPLSRWDAGRSLGKEALMAMILDDAAPDPTYLDALGKVLSDMDLDPAFQALVLALPSDEDMAQTLAEGGATPDPLRIEAARVALSTAVAGQHRDTLANIHDSLAPTGPFSPDAGDAAKRSLRNAALALLTRIDNGDRARAQFDTASNMTDSLAALTCLLRIGDGVTEAETFRKRWQSDRLVMDKWFALKVGTAPGETGVGIARELADDPDFTWKTPNRFRAVVHALGANHSGFHAGDGSGYAFVAEWILRMDPVVPQVAARTMTVFQTFRRYDADRKALAEAALRRISEAATLSRDTGEMVRRILES
ncbi:aminopeptidase N [Palleronia caenipelagi]|uniref:Aminopeptidase N n=1 Tax=Palleronia caenipelagi TaxID=2489174 RepID=A0A547QAX2_9RHOB|nr:aminopeptidase N [Palleronia caenipelagi]TRD23537.1 aminopeptidase N [Palleronia caenipelagi]